MPFACQQHDNIKKSTCHPREKIGRKTNCETNTKMDDEVCLFILKTLEGGSRRLPFSIRLRPSSVSCLIKYLWKRVEFKTLSANAMEKRSEKSSSFFFCEGESRFSYSKFSTFDCYDSLVDDKDVLEFQSQTGFSLLFECCLRSRDNKNSNIALLSVNWTN